jgi:hypothetical protein
VIEIRIQIILVVFVATLSVGCGTTDTRSSSDMFLPPPEDSDPFLKSLRGKGIHFVILYQLDGRDQRNDTIQLDPDGRIIKITGPFDRERREYDSAGFLTRRWVSSDYTIHFSLRYSIRSDSLVEIWREYNSADWHLRGDTTTSFYRSNLYVYDRMQRVIKGPDEGWRQVDYVYIDDRLTLKKAEVQRTGEERHVEVAAKYTYHNDGEIAKIEITSIDRPGKRNIIYFSNGLPDSCRFIYTSNHGWSSETRYRYRYVFY